MTAKRDRLGIIRDILRIVGEGGAGGARPTRVMYQANLSHEMLGEYMSELLAKGLISEQAHRKSGRKTYALTDKGGNFLSEYSAINNFLESYGLL